MLIIVIYIMIYVSYIYDVHKDIYTCTQVVYIWPTLRRKLKIKFKFRIHLIKVNAVKSADGAGEVRGGV